MPQSPPADELEAEAVLGVGQPTWHFSLLSEPPTGVQGDEASPPAATGCGDGPGATWSRVQGLREMPVSRGVVCREAGAGSAATWVARWRQKLAMLEKRCGVICERPDGEAAAAMETTEAASDVAPAARGRGDAGRGSTSSRRGASSGSVVSSAAASAPQGARTPGEAGLLRSAPPSIKPGERSAGAPSPAVMTPVL